MDHLTAKLLDSLTTMLVNRLTAKLVMLNSVKIKMIIDQKLLTDWLMFMIFTIFLTKYLIESLICSCVLRLFEAYFDALTSSFIALLLKVCHHLDIEPN